MPATALTQFKHITDLPVTIEQQRKASNGSPALYLIKVDGSEDKHIVGMLEKYTNTKTDTHPWKAFIGWGRDAQFSRSYYPEEGGKDAAIAMILRVKFPTVDPSTVAVNIHGYTKAKR